MLKIPKSLKHLAFTPPKLDGKKLRIIYSVAPVLDKQGDVTDPDNVVLRLHYEATTHFMRAMAAAIVRINGMANEMHDAGGCPCGECEGRLQELSHCSAELMVMIYGSWHSATLKLEKKSFRRKLKRSGLEIIVPAAAPGMLSELFTIAFSDDALVKTGTINPVTGKKRPEGMPDIHRVPKNKLN